MLETCDHCGGSVETVYACPCASIDRQHVRCGACWDEHEGIIRFESEGR